MKVNKILDYGNCGIVRFRGKEAYVKVVSLRTGTFYKVDAMGKVAQHIEALDLVVEIKNEVVQRINMSLPGEASIKCISGLKLPQKRGGSDSNMGVEYRGVSRRRSSLRVEYGELEYCSFKQRDPRIISDEGLNQRSGNNRNYL